jgi:hypothetical protein
MIYSNLMYEMIASEVPTICGVIRADTKMVLGHQGGTCWSSPAGADPLGRPLPTPRMTHAVGQLTLQSRSLCGSAGLHVAPGSQGYADTDAKVLGDADCGYIYPGERGIPSTHRHSRAPEPREGSRTCLLSPTTLVATGPKRRVTKTLQD